MESAWNPGLESEIPGRLWPAATLFREDTSLVSYQQALELSDLTGMDKLEFVAFKPQRLIVHALLVRVTADLSVPDGPNYEDLGINLRHMVHTLYSGHIEPAMDELLAPFVELRQRAGDYINKQLEVEERADDVRHAGNRRYIEWLRRWRSKKAPPAASSTPELATMRELDLAVLDSWRSSVAQCQDRLPVACLNALVQIVDRVLAHRGRMVLSREALTEVAVNIVSNSLGSVILDETLEPLWQAAVRSEGYRILPAQMHPVVMNVKGASASGKSTIRPRQRELAEKLGIAWDDFALISPDYWRKYLLNYDSLGKDYKYGAMLTGRELEIIDKKLDDYMAGKASRGEMSHLLIDRFRFDSFTVDIDRKPDSKLLSRFGHEVYLFFMVTHPAETVERAWIRGKKTGRYKAVDDLLYHNVEAFTGMPALFLSWVNSQDRKVHFEFLDNNVPFGELPRTTAFGWNGSMTILDVKFLHAMDQYRLVNIAAKSADEIFAAPVDGKPGGNRQSAFITQCVDRVASIVLADWHSGRPYAWIRDGCLYWLDRAVVSGLEERDEIMGVLENLVADAQVSLDDTQLEDAARAPATVDIPAERHVTVGQWAC